MSEPNKQFNVTLSPALKKRLQELAEQYGQEIGLDKGSKVGAKIIETYIEHWAQLQERIREGKKRVEQEIMAHLERPPLVKGKAQRLKKPNAREK